MKIGDIDVTNTLLNLEHDVNVLQQVLNHIMKHNTNVKGPTQKEIVVFQSNALEMLGKKYPNMGIKKN
ncbi:hypothetical protein OAV05_00300 [Flavobacteriaceae bacterium]|nr:hypothetical protein [Flavobacteriaceae bacterium]